MSQSRHVWNGEDGVQHGYNENRMKQNMEICVMICTVILNSFMANYLV